MSTSRIMHQTFLFTRSQKRRSKMPYEKAVSRLLKDNPNTDFLEPLNFYLGILGKADPVSILYMNPAQKQQLLRNVQVTYLLLLTEKRYELEHQKTEHIKQYDEQLQKCQLLIDLILYKKRCADQKVLEAPEQGYASPEKPTAYCGLFLGQYFAAQIMMMTDRKTKTVKESLAWINENRLSWVWDSALLKTMLSLLPNDFFYTDQAQKNVCTPDPYTGTMSWGLYYFRFSLNLSLLLKHTINGPWMKSEAEQNTPWTERFKTQWAHRKFTLLNDVVWATGNLLCFFWLYGQGATGTWGDMLTLILLMFDITLAVWEYAEQKTAHDKALLEYQTTIDTIQEHIKALHVTKEKNDHRLMELLIELSTIEKAKKQCVREWSYQNITLATNITYAVGLMLAFALLTAPFLPIAAATVGIMTIVGAILCFAFSVIANAIKGGIEIHKNKSDAKELEEQYAQLLFNFKELNRDHPEVENNAKKLLFLEIKKCLLESEHQENMLTLQQLKLLRSIVLESLIPGLVFLSLVFLPLGPGIGILAAAVALALISQLLINKFFTPEKKEFNEFNEAEYKSFHTDPDAWHKKITTSPSFFHTPTRESQATTDPYDEEDDDGNILQQSV